MDKENLIKIEQDFLSNGFSKEDSSEDLGWILLKDKIDDLQEVIAFVKEKDYGIPLQFTNYR